MWSIFNYLVAVLLVISSMLYVLSAVLLTYIKKCELKVLSSEMDQAESRLIR